MSRNSKNITFALPIEYIEKLRNYSDNSYIPSMNAGVKKALDALFKQIEKEKLYDIMQEASKDKMFLNDIDDTMNAYKFTDSEALGEDEEW